MKPPVNYYGGKQQMASEILRLINTVEHHGYAEIFAGGLAVFFAKNPSAYEIINDINSNVSNFYRTMQLQFIELNDLISTTLHCESEHRRAKEIYHSPEEHDSLSRAWAFWVSCNLSFGASPDNGFQTVKNKNDNWMPSVKTKNKREYFSNYKNRLERTVILNTDALKIIEKYDNEDLLFYIDPPYVGANQAHYKGYTQKDFDALLNALSKCKAKFILSSYPNEALDQYIQENNWNSLRYDMRIGVKKFDKGKKRKTEVLTYNFPEPQVQLSWI